MLRESRILYLFIVFIVGLSACNYDAAEEFPHPSEPLLPLTIRLSMPNPESRSTTPTPEESKVNRVTILVFQVPAEADRTNPAKYKLVSITDVQNPGATTGFTAYTHPSLFDIYVLVNLPKNNLFTNIDYYPPKQQFSPERMAQIKGFGELLSKRAHIKSQQSGFTDYNGLTMSGQLYSQDVTNITAPVLNIAVNRIAAKVSVTTIRSNPDVFHYVNIQSFLNITNESPIVPPLPARTSLPTINAITYCPDFEPTNLYAVSDYQIYLDQYDGATPKYSSPDANNLIPGEDGSQALDAYHVEQLRNNDEVALNSSASKTYYLFQNREAKYATRAVVRVNYSNVGNVIQKYLPIKINDGTHGGGSGFIQRNRIYNVSMTISGGISSYVTNPWAIPAGY